MTFPWRLKLVALVSLAVEVAVVVVLWRVLR